MLELECPNCGGQLEASENDFIQLDNIAIQTCQHYQCKYCKATFQRGQQINIAHADIVVHTQGGAYIKGAVNAKGDFVGRDLVIYNR